MSLSISNGIKNMKTAPRVTAAQLEVVRHAAQRSSLAVEPLPHKFKGAAKRSILDALVARGYAAKCYFPGHVEYVLTEAGLALDRSAMAHPLPH